MKKRILSVLLAICLLVSVLPIGTVLSTAESTTPSDVTITVVDENGKNITDSALSVKVTHAYGNNWLNYTENVVVTNYGNGVFGYDSSDYNRNNYQFKTKYYTIKATLTVDGRTYSTSVQAEKDATSVVITLDDFIQGDKWAKFDVYYIADGHFPNVFLRLR